MLMDERDDCVSLSEVAAVLHHLIQEFHIRWERWFLAKQTPFLSTCANFRTNASLSFTFVGEHSLENDHLVVSQFVAPEPGHVLGLHLVPDCDPSQALSQPLCLNVASFEEGAVCVVPGVHVKKQQIAEAEPAILDMVAFVGNLSLSYVIKPVTLYHFHEGLTGDSHAV